ncbi:MAG: alpha/beta fold hydrolase [Candidatus Freyarchaeum deiterrae]
MKHQRISFVSDGINIVGDILIPSSPHESPFPAVCYLHGFPGDANKTEIGLSLARMGYVYLCFDFRGHRESTSPDFEGPFSFKGEITDCRNAINYLTKLDFVDKSRIGLYGESMGGGVAICFAAEDNHVKAVAVRAPVFDTELMFSNPLFEMTINSMEYFLPGEVVGLNYPNLLSLLREEAKEYNPIKLVHKISPKPLLIVAGAQDELIPLEGVKALYEKAKEPKELIILDADHNLTPPSVRKRVFKTIVDWLVSHV